eukprot:s1553_g25.t1
MSCLGSALLQAISDGDVQRASQVLARGAPVDEKDKAGETALVLAVRTGQTGLVQDMQGRAGPLQKCAGAGATWSEHGGERPPAELDTSSPGIGKGRKLAHLQIAALAKNLSMLDSLEEDLVKALDDMETAAHQAQLSQLGSVSAAYKFLRSCFRGQALQDVTPLMEPLLSSSEQHHATSTPRQRASEQRQRFLGLLTDAQTYAKQHPDHDGIALFQQRVAMAWEIRRLFPFEVDPMEDMPILSVYMCSLRIRWSYFFLCALFTALALFAGTITELFFAVFAAGADISVGQQVWLSFWLLPFGAMFLALVGDEMGDLVIDAIDRPPLLWCLSLVLAAVQRDRRLAPARSTCEAASALGSSALQRCAELRQRVSEFSEVDMLIIGLSEARARAGFWHGYMQGGLIAAFWLTLVVLLADVTIGIYGSRAQQALRHIYHVLDKHKICPGTIAARYELLRSHFEQVSLQQNREQGCKRFATLLVFAWQRARGFMLESWSLCAFTQQNALMPVTLVAWTAVSALAVQDSTRGGSQTRKLSNPACPMFLLRLEDRFQFPVAVSAIMMVFTVTVLSVKMAMAFPDVAGPFYTVILIFFVCAALGLQVGGSFALGPKTVQPLMRMPGIFTGPTDLPHAWRGNRSEPPYAACRITWGSQEAPVSVLDCGADLSLCFAGRDLASLALIAYEVDCNAVPRLLEESFGSGMHAPRLESCRGYDELPRWISVRFPARRPGGGDTRVFAIKGTSSWRDVYADIKLFATIEVLQALSKIVPILSLLPVPLVQSIVGHTGLADTYMWDGLERAIDKDHRKRDVSVLTGHSLGGCIAQIVAGRRQLSALVFSSPGLLYSARRFDVSPESIRHVVAVVPDGDVISSVDEHAGVVQRIACRTRTGQALTLRASFAQTSRWAEEKTLGGDVRGRDFSDTCVAYVLPERAPKLSTWLFQKSQGRLHPCEKLMLLLLPLLLLLLLLFEFPAGAAIVQILLAAQASVDAAGRDGETPVQLASLLGALLEKRILHSAALLQARASPDIAAHDGKRAQDLSTGK